MRGTPLPVSKDPYIEIIFKIILRTQRFFCNISRARRSHALDAGTRPF
jgi:hypothetical protein